MSDLPQQETYLGDGLYARFDGWQVVLRALRSEGDHFVALEPEIYRALLRWLEDYPALKQHMERA